MDKDFLKKLDALLNRSEYAKLSKAASNAIKGTTAFYGHQSMLSQLREAQTIDETMQILSNTMRIMYGADTAIKCTNVMVAYIKKEAASTCLTMQEAAQIVAQEVNRLLMHGIVPEQAVNVGIRNSGKRLYEAHWEKMAKHRWLIENRERSRF